MRAAITTAGQSDVLVMGAGMAGLAAATHLARAGHRVTCIEPDRFPRARVGESLDWSSPRLLRRLGYRVEDLVGQSFGTYKCDIEAVSPERAPLAAHPPRLLGRRPYGAAMTTVHLDRERFDRSLYERARNTGVQFMWETVASVEMDGDRVSACVTRTGQRLEARWFVDATGPSRLIGRAAGIGVRDYATPRVCLWTQFVAPRARLGTTLSLDTTRDELEWAWEIPLADDRQSLGLVMSSEAFKSLERRGRSKAQVLVELLARFPRYASLEPDALGEVRTRSYRPYVSDRVVGANWLMVGEAAAMIDPLTSVGVTAALRNGSEAAMIIACSNGRVDVERAKADYERRVRSLGDLYNSAIQSLIYEPGVRRPFGLRAAGIAYVLVGYGTNTLYTRLRPTTSAKTTVLTVIISTMRLWRRTWVAAARMAARGGTIASTPG